jgi:hypothetical protein
VIAIAIGASRSWRRSSRRLVLRARLADSGSSRCSGRNLDQRLLWAVKRFRARNGRWGIAPSFITPWRGESATVGHQLLAAGADPEVGLRIVSEVAAREGPVVALGIVERFPVRLDSALVHQPAQRLGRAIARVGDQARSWTSNGSAVRSSIVLAAATSARRMAVVASTSMIAAGFRSN